MEPPDLREPGPGRAPAAAGGEFGALDELPEAAVVLAPVRDDAGAVTDFVFDYANAAAAAAAAAVGATADELIGRTLLDTLPAFPAELLERLAEAVENGGPLRTQLDYRDAFAGRATFEGRFDVTASRVAGRLLVVSEDLTARERALAAERRFGAVIEATSDWVSIADRDERLMYVNAAGRRMVGLGPDEDVVGLRLGEFAPAWAREQVLREALPIARREGVWRGDMARLHRDGHEIPVSQVIVAHTDEAGEVEFYATIARDMTREREREEALRASEERFRVAFEQGPTGVSLLDLDGNFVQVNDAYCRTVRRSREELLRLGPVAITHPDDVAVTRTAMRSLLVGEVPVFRFEKRYIAPGGDVVWVEVSGTIFRDAQQRPQFLIGMVQDIGERHIAHTLQRSMLTTQLPEVEGIEFAVRYLPSSSDAEVSGDWYDVIPLPDGRIGVVIGDVVGRGVDAAATMSQLRTALRAYAVEGLEPAEVVAKLHRLVDHLRVGLSTTLTYLDLDPFTLELRYVSAGHLPMLHAPANGSPRFLAGARSPPLGAAPVQTPIPQERVVLEPGDGLLLYTDGLVERRDAGIDARLEALREAVSSAPRDLDALLKHLTASLAHDGVRTDDIALLALRAQGAPPGSLETAARAVPAALGPLRAELREWLPATGATAGAINDVLIAVGEACSNAIEHSGAGADAEIDVRARISGRELVVTVADRGTWREATAPGHRGHGLRLMRVLSRDVKISTAQNGTRVELRFRLGAAEEDTAGLEHRLPAVPALGVEHADEVPVARVHGDVDLERVQELGSTLAATVGPRDRGLVLDLSAVDYLDSSGVHLVHQLMLTLEQRGQQLRVVAAPGAPVLRVLEIVDLHRSVPLDDSVAAAVAALARPPLGD
jgi:anti-anti-sigma factor